jgi:hypothetical protein
VDCRARGVGLEGAQKSPSRSAPSISGSRQADNDGTGRTCRYGNCSSQRRILLTEATPSLRLSILAPKLPIVQSQLTELPPIVLRRAEFDTSLSQNWTVTTVAASLDVCVEADVVVAPGRGHSVVVLPTTGDWRGARRHVSAIRDRDDAVSNRVLACDREAER